MIGGRLGHVAFRAVTSQVRMMPDFLVIGVHRGGTSAFYYHLTEHPDIAAATTKEINYFDKNFHKGVWWYRTHFPAVAHKRYMEMKSGRHLLTGEASPHYVLHPNVPERVARIVPHAKLIALLRNPVDRAYSHYRRYIHLGWEALPFDEVSANEEQRLRTACASGAAVGDDPRDVVGRSSYLARGIYADQLRRWLCLFPREQLLVLRSEDFYANPAQSLKQTLAFLGVPPDGLPEKDDYDHYDGYASPVDDQSGMPREEAHEDKPSDKPSDKRPEERDERRMDPAIRERLSAFFAPHNHRLYELLGRDMGWA